MHKIAIVNRGEPAMRLVRAVQELQNDGQDLCTVALHVTEEAGASFVRAADEAYDLGPAADRPYINLGRLKEALLETGADAAWVGWGFVAENAEFSAMCRNMGVTFIGPSPEAMNQLGDKIGSKLLAEKAGVPMAPWSNGPVDTIDEALAAAERIGYPVMLKATAGGGGRGIRKVTNAEELADVFERNRQEALNAFGNESVFLAKLVNGARHVEVQVLGDGQGTAWALGVRDCTLQRRNQKVIEESASPALTPEQVAELKTSAERLINLVDYCGAATVEFLYRPADRLFGFLEVNTRLQVEHSVTEAATGFDLVKGQIQVASGIPLTGDRPVESGHAIEARLNAEDPDRDFAPAPGLIELLRLPAGPGVRVDAGFMRGDVIPGEFDSMIAKIIAHGANRDEAWGRLRRAVAETETLIVGGTTNKSFLLDLLDNPTARSVDVDTAWIDRARADGQLGAAEDAGVALAIAGILSYEERESQALHHLLETAHGGRPAVDRDFRRPVTFKLRDVPIQVAVSRTGAHSFEVSLESADEIAQVAVSLEWLPNGSWSAKVNGRPYRGIASANPGYYLVEANGHTNRLVRDEGGIVRSPAPALVVAVRVSAGDEVEAGQPLIILESMKMETRVLSPAAGTVREVLISNGQLVGAGEPLVTIDPSTEGSAETASAPASIDLQLPPRPERPNAALVLAQLRSTLLGFDEPPSGAQVAKRYPGLRQELAEGRVALYEQESELLEIAVDLMQLSSDRSTRRPYESYTRVHTPREEFHSYLQSLDTDRANVTEVFRANLARAFGRYGITDLDRNFELEMAVFRLFLATSDSKVLTDRVAEVLRDWLEDSVEGHEGSYDLLQRLVTVTQVRFPVISNLARSVRSQWFDEPRLEAVRSAALADVPERLRYLGEHPDASDYDDVVAELTNIPEPLVRFLATSMVAGAASSPEPMLVVLAHRHYQESHLANVQRCQHEGRSWVSADFRQDGRSIQLLTTVGTLYELTDGSGFVDEMAAQIRKAPDGATATLDLFISRRGDARPLDELTDQLGMALQPLAAMPLRRVVICLVEESGDQVDYLTYVPSGDHLIEDQLVRGIHPTVSRRLNLWRLRLFHLERLETSEEVRLYRAVAKSNPRDVRLIALAQVRDLTKVYDEQGQLVSVPRLEHTVNECVEAVRRWRPVLTNHLEHNHVWVRVWPTIQEPIDDLAELDSLVGPQLMDAGIVSLQVQGHSTTDNDAVLNITFDKSLGAHATLAPAPQGEDALLQPENDYQRNVARSRRRGATYPYELAKLLAGPHGQFIELDLDDENVLSPTYRAPGQNTAGIVVGRVTTPTSRHPQGLQRIVLMGDPTKGLGTLAEPESRRVIAALDLAEAEGLPVDWFTLSSGAKIAMDSGTENLDWIARALRRQVSFTQAGHEINVVVSGINVGGQPYWNAESTMLMHTRGILIMISGTAMVLTGKDALDFSGAVSAEDNIGIGGYDRIMGPNGEAQYWATDMSEAITMLMSHHDTSYVLPGERYAARAVTTDRYDRDISSYPHDAQLYGFKNVGEIFSNEFNPGRKKPFDIRTVMRAVADQDCTSPERWRDLAGGETAVVTDTRVGGWPVCLIGIEGHSIPRKGFLRSDGPDSYSAGTLFPQSAKKLARAINSASGSRAVVVLANLSGFDGSPESLRNLQLEYGAEIGRAIVNFDGPIVFTVLSRYHGGAFVVFSKALNDAMTVLALEGSYASVIGGAPAAAVVFSREVDRRTANDPVLKALAQQIKEADDESEQAQLESQYDEKWAEIRQQRQQEVADEFDAFHTVERAVRVGSVDEIIPVVNLRPTIIDKLTDWHGQH